LVPPIFSTQKVDYLKPALPRLIEHPLYNKNL
jgi:hypothetical protein